MKITYLLGAIFASSLTGTLLAGRTAKTVCLIASGALSLYGLLRIVF